MSEHDRPDDDWRAEVFADVWNVAGDFGYHDAPGTVDKFSRDYFVHWGILFPNHQRPDYLALRSVVRSALRAAGGAEW